MLYDKNDETYGPLGFLMLIVLCFLLLVLCSGCSSGADAVEPDIIKLERRIAELETINRELTERLDSTTTSIGRTKEITDQCRDRIERIQETARGINDIVTRVEYLFTQYEYEVSRLLSEIDTSGAYDIDTSQD